MRTRDLRDDVEIVSISLQATSLTDIEALAFILAELAISDNDTKLAHKMPLHNLAEPRRRQHVPGQYRGNRSPWLAHNVPGGAECNPG